MFGKHKFLLRESRRKSWLSSCDLEFSPLNKFILGGNTTLYSFCQTNMYSEEFFLGLYSIQQGRVMFKSLTLIKGQCRKIFGHNFLHKRFVLGPISTGKNSFSNFLVSEKIFQRKVQKLHVFVAGLGIRSSVFRVNRSFYGKK